MQGRTKENRQGVRGEFVKGGPKPYFASDSVRLYRGDCVQLLQELQELYAGQIAAAITSPPYAQQRASTYGGIPEEDYPAWTVGWMQALRPLLTPAGSVMVNIREHRRKKTGMSDYVHRTRLAVRESGFFEVDEIPWIKPNSFPGGVKTLPRVSWERVLWFSPASIPDCQPRDMSKKPLPADRTYASAQRYSKRIGSSGTGSGPGYVHKPPRRPNWILQAIATKLKQGYHPARFPVGLARQLLTFFDGELLLDPFGGSGTTGVAAMQEGRRAILIEQSEEYCELAARRLEDTEKELTQGIKRAA